MQFGGHINFWHLYQYDETQMLPLFVFGNTYTNAGPYAHIEWWQYDQYLQCESHIFSDISQ